jgi:hypothetical protein
VSEPTTTAVLRTWARWQVVLRDIIDDTPVWDSVRTRVATDSRDQAAAHGDILGPVHIAPPRPVVVHPDFTWRPWSTMDGPDDRAEWFVIYVYVPIAVPIATPTTKERPHDPPPPMFYA